jgi:branched-chain amino acid aminotransferase
LSIVCIFVSVYIKLMNECYGDRFILNGELQTADLFDSSLIYEGDSVYEVIRMVKGLPVFFQDHMERLVTSVRLQNKPGLADINVLKRDILALVRTGKKKEINLKIVFNYNIDSNNYLLYFIKPVYPAISQYKSGVKGVLFYAERKDPESKVINHKLRSEIYHKLILDGAYEALLVNHKNCITEGSRSNIFFLKGDNLVTAPDNTVLAGITRKYIFEICRENKIKVEFKCVNADKISEFDSVIMTGTSPMVLPFSSIDKTFFNVNHHLIEQLRNLYIQKSEESMRQFAEEY